MAVKVILKQNVPNLGQAGDVKQVKPGYFRNYLLPRGLAIEASKGNLRSLEANRLVEAGHKAKAQERSSTAANQLAGITLRIPVKLGEQGRIYGSVTNRDIAEALDEQAHMQIDRHQIELPEPLKSLGVHEVPVRLDHGVDAQLSVELVPDSETE